MIRSSFITNFFCLNSFKEVDRCLNYAIELCINLEVKVVNLEDYSVSQNMTTSSDQISSTKRIDISIQDARKKKVYPSNFNLPYKFLHNVNSMITLAFTNITTAVYLHQS